jgi:Type VI secretion system VasI, EvfG, VC_A0118
MKRCPGCSEEIPESAAACLHCGQEISDSPAAAESPTVETPVTAAPAAPAPQPPPAGWGSREVFAGMAAVFFGGALVFALLVMRSDAPPEAAAAHSAAAAPVPAPATSSSPSSSATATWSTASVDRWIGNGRRKFAIELAAENRVTVWQRQVKPVLVVRCLTQRPEVFVFTDSAAKIEPKTEDHTVHITLDDGEEVSELWPDSADHDALFAPDGTAFARRLAAARTMRFGFTPHNSPAVQVHFSVAGLEQHLAAAARECGWKP